MSSIGGFAPWSNISDERVKKNIKQNVPGLEFIKRLQPVTYNMDLDEADRMIKALMPQPKEIEGDSLMPLRASAPEPIETEAMKESRAASQKRLHTGFVAQDVEKAAQSIGYEFSGIDVDDSGIYALRYSEFVVPLVKAVQELSEQNDAKDAAIAELRDQVNELTELVNRLLEKKEAFPAPSPASDASMGISIPDATLEQNFPNPFNQVTNINYTLPQNFNSAKIVISDTSGRVCRQIVITGAGAGNTIVSAGSLSAGIYYYSLIVDNTLVDTKKMVLTK